MSFKTCVSLAETKPRKLVILAKKTLKKSDFVELRLDFLPPEQIPDVLNSLKKEMSKCVCTLRPKWEGGNFNQNEKERISLLKLISEFNPYFIDIEFKTLVKNQDLVNYIKTSKTQILVSWHEFHFTPNDNTLRKQIKKMRKISKNLKIVTLAKNLGDSSRILSLYHYLSKTNLIAFSMGKEGQISRILCLYLGSPYTYVSLGKPVAPGQFSLKEAKSIIKATQG